MLLLKKPFSEASKDFSAQVAIICVILGIVVLGEISVNVIEPLKVTAQTSS